MAGVSGVERTPAGVGLIGRIAMAIGIAPEGMPLSLGALAIAIIVLGFGLHWLAAALFVVALAIGAFFRDPERIPPNPENAILSAADGSLGQIHQNHFFFVNRVTAIGTPAQKEFFQRHNPVALQEATERLLEAAERGLWEHPGEATLSALEENLLELQGQLE